MRKQPVNCYSLALKLARFSSTLHLCRSRTGKATEITPLTPRSATPI